MAKTVTGTVVSTKMTGTIVIEITRRVPHPKYQKLMKRSKKFKAALIGQTVALGDTVVITETKPISKDVHFMVTEVKKGDK